MGRFELNLDCHVTALQAQSKLAISSSFEVCFCSMSTCWKDNFNTFPMDPAPRLYLFCTSRSFQNKCRVMLSPCVFEGYGRVRLRVVAGLRAIWPRAGAHVSFDWNILCHLSRVSSTNERTSDRIYPAESSRICVERVIELLHLRCAAWNSRSSSSSDRGSL